MSGRIHIQRYGATLLLALSLASCQVKRPKTVLSDAKMENVLYDYHIAKAMSEELSYNENYKRALYLESVFHKYGITQADFDTSMVWYTRNPGQLAKVYEKVNARLKAKREAIDRLVALRDNKPSTSAAGDSVDVWFKQHIFRLTGGALNNKLLFSQPADENYQERDTLCWSLRFRFQGRVPDRLEMPWVALQMQYEKRDSIVSMIKQVERPGVEMLSLSADTLGKIKEIRGFVYYPAREQSPVLLLDHISLMRYHAQDSLVVALPDSLQQSTDKASEETPSTPLNPVLNETPSKLEEGDAVRKPARPRPALPKTNESLTRLPERK